MTKLEMSKINYNSLYVSITICCATEITYLHENCWLEPLKHLLTIDSTIKLKIN